MTVRAKFQLQEMTSFNYAPVPKKLLFRAAYDNTIPEDQRFQKATPWGEFAMTVDNPAALEQFELGKHYYFDISPAD